MTKKPTKPKREKTEKRGKRLYDKSDFETLKTGEYLKEYQYDDYRNGIADAYAYVRRRLP